MRESLGRGEGRTASTAVTPTSLHSHLNHLGVPRTTSKLTTLPARGDDFSTITVAGRRSWSSARGLDLRGRPPPVGGAMALGQTVARPPSPTTDLGAAARAGDRGLALVIVPIAVGFHHRFRHRDQSRTAAATWLPSERRDHPFTQITSTSTPVLKLPLFRTWRKYPVFRKPRPEGMDLNVRRQGRGSRPRQ